MLSFATEFPVNSNKSAHDFMDAVREWVLGSPHTELQRSDLASMDKVDEWNTQPGAETVGSLLCSTENVAAARYTRIGDEIEWSTTIVFRRIQGVAWTTIRTSCESVYPQVRLPAAKKPVVVRILMQRLGAGKDGSLQVQDAPHFLGDHNIDLAAALLNGTAGCRLPIVYVSAAFGGVDTAGPRHMARELSGMAHVVVEPNRPFSQRLRISVDHNNVYGGTIGIYWPDGSGRRAFYVGHEFHDAEELTSAVCEEVRSALTNRRPLEDCTWASVQGIVSRQRVIQLQASGSREVASYIEGFESELTAAKEQRQHAETEVERLRAELRGIYARKGRNDAAMPWAISEQDFYPGEVLDVIRDALVDARTRVPPDSRRLHVLDAFLSAHPETGGAKQYRERLKHLLKDYTGLDKKTRRTLEEIGFSISEEGKHCKITFQGDDRYTFTLPKSGSDYRGGRNSASDIGKLLF